MLHQQKVSQKGPQKDHQNISHNKYQKKLLFTMKKDLKALLKEQCLNLSDIKHQHFRSQ